MYSASSAVLLRARRRRQVLHEHLEERVVRGQPLLHAALEERLLAELEVLLGQRDADRAEHLRAAVELSSIAFLNFEIGMRQNTAEDLARRRREATSSSSG